MKFRHEWKHEINNSDLMALRSRLSVVMKPDKNGDRGRYKIRSLYFDNLNDKALREKMDGVNRREKFRLRYYNDDTSFILLEKKSKVNGLCSKEKVRISEEIAGALTEGDTSFMTEPGRISGSGGIPGEIHPLLQEFCTKMRIQGLRPKTIVEYTRQAYVYGPGNVRVTLDYGIRTGITGTDFLNPGAVMIPAGNAPAILEVKWDEFLPSVIRDAVQLKQCRTTAYSKYAACRIYG